MGISRGLSGTRLLLLGVALVTGGSRFFLPRLRFGSWDAWSADIVVAEMAVIAVGSFGLAGQFESSIDDAVAVARPAAAAIEGTTADMLAFERNGMDVWDGWKE